MTTATRHSSDGDRALTLCHWVRRLEESHEQALRHVDDPTYRVWRFFMAGSAYGFATGRLNIYQSLLSKPSPGGHSGLPLTRRDWILPSARAQFPAP